MELNGTWHVSRSWGRPDEWAGHCGCEVALCGNVIANSNPNCDQHAFKAGKTLRVAHSAEMCPVQGMVGV
jgi:hypothetical protein